MKLRIKNNQPTGLLDNWIAGFIHPSIHPLILCAALFLALRVSATTLFYDQEYNEDGSPQTNLVTFQVWPPDANAFTVYGTNIIFSNHIITNTPGPTGYYTNGLFPNTYVVRIPSSGRFFYAKILDTAIVLPLAYYATNIANVNNPLNMYGLVTNWLGFAPMTNSFTGAIAALGYSPMTNSFAAVTNALHYFPLTNSFAAITNGLNYAPLSNSYAAITNGLNFGPATNSYSGAIAALGFAPITNSFAALTNAIGYTPATNSYPGAVAALGFQPATNTYAAATNLLANNIVALLGYLPATNTSTMLIAALGYVPANITNTPGLLSGPGFSIVTNGASQWLSTNLPTGVAPILPLPDGSFLITTNGEFYVRSNLLWIKK